jgi:hypothetical protein
VAKSGKWTLPQQTVSPPFLNTAIVRTVSDRGCLCRFDISVDATERTWPFAVSCVGREHDAAQQRAFGDSNGGDLGTLRVVGKRVLDCSRLGDGPNQAAPRLSVPGGMVC